MNIELTIQISLICLGGFLLTKGIYKISMEKVLKANSQNYLDSLSVSIPYTFVITFFIGALFSEKYLWEAVTITFLLSISATFAAINQAIKQTRKNE